MANKYKITINGYDVKELRCKDDNCRALLGYESIKIGVLIIICEKCGLENIFNCTYRKIKKEFFDDLQKKFESKGGEK